MDESFRLRKWLGLLALMPGIAMVFIDQAVLPVAIPRIKEHFHATHTQLWWSINSYLLVSAVLMLGGGKWGDKMGYRQSFLLGIVLFAIASALCGMSLSIEELIVTRALQGVGAALMIPASSPLIMSLFPEGQRGKALGVNVSMSSLFMIVAPWFGGYITETFSWRWIFWFNLPLAALCIALILRYLPRPPRKDHPFDWIGFSFFSVCLGAFVTFVMQGREWGWTSFPSLFSLGGSLVLGCLLLRREKEKEHPLIDLSLFRHTIYKAVHISVFFTQFILMITVYRAIFFQEVMGWSALKSGTVFSLTSIPVLFMPLIGGSMADRWGPRIPVGIGFFLLVFSCCWIAFFVQGALFWLVVGFFLFTLGVCLVFTPSYASAMGAIPKGKAGAAFGILATTRGVASTLGVAVLGSFTKDVHLLFLGKLLNQNPSLQNLDPSWVDHLVASHQKSDLSSHQMDLILTAMKESEIDSFITVHLVAGIVLALVALVVMTLYRRASRCFFEPISGETKKMEPVSKEEL